MRNRTLSLISGVAFFVVICVALNVILTCRERAVNVAVLFVGYTNRSDGALWAMFRVANNGDAAIRRWVYQEAQQQLGGPPAFCVGPRALVGPGESEIVAIRAITNQGAWRISVLCAEYGPQMKIQEDSRPE